MHVRGLDGAPAGGGRGGDAVDGTALDQYRARILAIEAELDEADANADLERFGARSRRRGRRNRRRADALGRPRRLRPPGRRALIHERLRKAVSARVKVSIERLEQLHPGLGRHLRVVHTGFWCRYDPERTVTWTVKR